MVHFVVKTQTSTLKFDTAEDYANLELDKLGYKNRENVLVTITDLWLNIDPTSKDSWTFNTVNGFPHYQVFDENGNEVGDTATNTDNDLGDVLADLMCSSNCKLLLNPNVNGTLVDVITIQDNEDSNIITVDEGDPQDPLDQLTPAGYFLGEVPVTITELGPNSGTFGSFDESNVSNIVITNDAVVNSTASIDYNEILVTIQVIPIEPCQVQLNGNWTVTKNCQLMVSSAAPANVIVQNNSLVTIPNGVTLDIDFESYGLTVKSGSGVLIKAGGKIT